MPRENEKQKRHRTRSRARFLSASFLLLTIPWLMSCQQSAGPANPLTSHVFEQVQPDTTVEFSFKQTPKTTLLVKVSGNETEFDVRVVQSDGEVHSTGKTWYLRLFPLYFVLEPRPSFQAIKIEVDPVHATSDASVRVEVFELPDKSKADNQAIAAYRLYQAALEATDSEAKDVWMPRVEGLKEAAQLFKTAGLDEQALWAQSLAANFYYYPIYDNPAAIELATNAQREAEDMDFPKIALLNLSTQGQALMERDPEDSFEATLSKQHLAQERFEAALNLAAEHGFGFERAWAMNNRGIGYYYLDEHDEAIDWYGQALDAAKPLGDRFFTNLVVGNMALAQEKLGDFEGVLDVLTSINRDLRVEEDTNQLIHNLTDTGRLYRLLYKFPESIEALDEAWKLAEQTNDVEALGRIGLWLAMAYRSMGYLERAGRILDEAIPKMETVNNGRLLREAHQVAANIARSNGETESMRRHREAQRKYSSSDANHATYFYDRGMDGMATGTGEAKQYFSQSLEQYEAAGFEQMIWMSKLRLCRLEAGSVSGSLCEMTDARQALDFLQSRSMTFRRLEAQHIWAGILSGNGKKNEAISVLDELISELAFLRQNLPGVLGAWYWSSRDQVFEDYLSLIIEQDIQNGDGTASLQALGRLRSIGQTGNTSAMPEEERRQLRRLLARRDRSNEEEIETLEQDIDRLLLANRGGLESTQETSTQRTGPLFERLPPESGLLAYHFSSRGAWSWLVTGYGVRLIPLEDVVAIPRRLTNARSNFQTVGYNRLDIDLDEIGRLLIAPLGEELPKTIYLVAGGQLGGFPFDAIRHNGRYLVEDHVVINLLSLDRFESVVDELPAVAFERIFLAGDPLVAGSQAPALASTATELKVIAGQFLGAEVHTVQAGDLKLESFQSNEFQNADLVHIATHGRIDMQYPELSRLMLSAEKGEEVYLTPRDINHSSLAASLVVLSACETSGTNEFSWDANLGFVSEFAGGSDTSVIASLWPVGDKFAAEFFGEFYKRTAEGLSPSAALSAAKLGFLKSNQDAVLKVSAFQFIQN